jgi:hypothetical protein
MSEDIESLTFKYECIKEDQTQLDNIIDSYFTENDSLPEPIKILFDYGTKILDGIELLENVIRSFETK